MAVVGFAATVGSAAYLISTRSKPEAEAEELQAAEAAADDSTTESAASGAKA
jgi:hypothetical protein